MSRDHIDQTVAALVASQRVPGAAGDREAAARRLADSEARVRRFQDAIGAGTDPAALVDAVNQAQAVRAAARPELDNTPAPDHLGEAEVYAMVAAALNDGRPEQLAHLYAAVDPHIRYHADENAADVTVRPVGRVNSARVRGASCTLSTRLHLSR